MQCGGAEILHFLQFHRLHLAAKAFIHFRPVLLPCRTDDIGKLLGVTIRIGMTDSAQEIQGLRTNLYIGLNERLQERHISTHVTQRHHRCTVTHQRIVRIVPFGTEGIHPYTGVGYEVRQFGEQRDQQFIRHRRKRLRSRIACLNTFMFFVVKTDTVLGVCHNLRIRFQPIRYVRKRVLTGM